MSAQFSAFSGGRQAPEPSFHEDENNNSSDSSLRSHPKRGGKRPPMDEF